MDATHDVHVEVFDAIDVNDDIVYVFMGIVNPSETLISRQ
jgi:hypothetical protein